MAVALRGFTQGEFSAGGIFSVAWPAGTVVGDLALWLVAPGSDKKPAARFPSGWLRAGVKSDGTAVWWKILSSTDIAVPLSIEARIEAGIVLSGAGGIGRVGTGESLSVKAGGALALAGWKSTSDDLTPGKIHPDDIVNLSFVVKNNARRYNWWLRPMTVDGTAYIDTNAAAFFGVEVLPQTVPNGPILVAPEDSAFITYAGRVSLAGQHQSASPTGKMLALSTRLRPVGDPTWRYVALTVGDAFTLTTTPTTIGNSWFSSLTVNLPVSLLSNNTTYEWQMADSEQASGGGLSAWSPTRTFSLRSKPTVSPAVSGTELARTVSWTETLTNGVQTSFQVEVVEATDAGVLLGDFDLFGTLGDLDGFGALGDLDNFYGEI